MGVRVGGDSLNPITSGEFDTEIAAAAQSQSGPVVVPGIPVPIAPATPPTAPNTGSVQGGDKMATQMKMNQALAEELGLKSGRAGLSEADTQKLARILNRLPPEEFDRAARLFEDALHSGNRVAAMRAFLDLEPMRAAHPDRITPEIERSLVMGVGEPRLPSASPGTRGGLSILGFDAADRAARTLIKMPANEYQAIAETMSKAGPGEGASTNAQRTLILKAVAARSSELTDEGWQQRNGNNPNLHRTATLDVVRYGEAIRGKDRAELAEKSTVLDLSSREGDHALQQRYESSCAPTSVQIAEAEADPVKALAMHQEGIHSTSTGGGIAAEQKQILLRHNGIPLPLGPNSPRVRGSGLVDQEIVNALNEKATPLTNRTYSREVVKDSSKDRAAALDRLEPLLRDRVEVPITVNWGGGSSHLMVMSEVQGAKPDRSFLITDPADGKSKWLREDEIVKGHTDFFGDAGTLGNVFPSVRR